MAQQEEVDLSIHSKDGAPSLSSTGGSTNTANSKGQQVKDTNSVTSVTGSRLPATAGNCTSGSKEGKPSAGQSEVDQILKYTREHLSEVAAVHEHLGAQRKRD